MAGKGSAPRKGANQKAYEANWESIFGKKDENENDVKKDGQVSKKISSRQSNKKGNDQAD